MTNLHLSPIDPNGTLWVDNWSLQSVSQCETKTLTRYAWGWTGTEEKLAADCGTVIHECQALYYRTGNAHLALKHLKRRWKATSEAIDPTSKLARLRLENVSLIYEEWLAQHPITDDVLYNNAGLGLFRIDPALVEISFNYVLDPRCVCGHVKKDHHTEEGYNPCREDGCACEQYVPRTKVYGRFDAVVEHLQSGHWLINDHKSTGMISAPWIEKFKLNGQISEYVWAGEQAAERPVLGAIITAIELSKLPDSDRKCAKHALPYFECARHHAKFETFTVDRRPDQVQAWKRAAIAMAERYRALIQRAPGVEHVKRVLNEGQLGDEACRWCDAKEWCLADRPAATISGYLSYEPWVAFDAETAERISSSDPRHPRFHKGE